jgi:hypothetical protein
MNAVTHADATDEQRAKRLALDLADGDPDGADRLLAEAREHAEAIIGAARGRTRRLAGALLDNRELDAAAVAALMTQEAQ